MQNTSTGSAGPVADTFYRVKLGESMLESNTSSPYVVLRYSTFKPVSADMSRTGSVTVEHSNKTYVDLPSTSNPKSCISFKGSTKECKQEECILLFDAVTKTFRLERLHSKLHVNHDRGGEKLGVERLAKLEKSKAVSSSTKSKTVPKQTPRSSPPSKRIKLDMSGRPVEAVASENEWESESSFEE